MASPRNTKAPRGPSSKGSRDSFRRKASTLVLERSKSSVFDVPSSWIVLAIVPDPIIGKKREVVAVLYTTRATALRVLRALKHR